ncbi:MAG: hypothetical protein GF411_16810 [Candidatus Lokiarchaeota archaeon]|nr:hypothetical protein [Candidatus Lokiarchaeota archaeon]
MKKPKTVIVTSNKGGSGKSPMSVNLAVWALSRPKPWKVLAIDINHTNQDFFQSMQHLQFSDERKFDTAFSLDKVGTCYYLPLSDNLHLVRPREFLPLSPSQTTEIISKSDSAFAKQTGNGLFNPDLIVVDGNYCFPSYRVNPNERLDIPPYIFMNIWSITSPHELRLPTAYRKTIQTYRDVFDCPDWDSTHFINVFSVLEKERKLTSEFQRLVSLQRSVYDVPGSDDLAGLYKKIVRNTDAKEEGFSFDAIQNEIFSPILAELESLMVEDPKSYSEDVINARWVERVNIFLTKHKVFPVNVLPFPHYYPFLRKAVVDMILRERFDLEFVRKLFGDFYKWMSMYLDRFFTYHIR